ncbi:glutamate ABC transporter substrate-binding protein [Brevibacterium zhoupengii]|uniref:glutamate ABC transporter substrate-binding protein n=1 Tax=Brevibacterium zhoupengii TaxID=2898795 RepID=UPI001E4C669B|nr:glutamate ABC transporter substrate-binding protein [Brevibacterium zhoupengii]
MRKLNWVIVATVLGLSLSGCGQGGTPSNPGDGEERPTYEVRDDVDLAGSPTWKGAQEQNSITIGVYHDQPGIGNLTAGAERPEGFDVEIATLVAGQLGFAPEDIEWVETVTANRETFLQQGNVDLIVAGYTINDERKKIIDFAGPYYTTGQDLMVSSDSDISGPDDLDGKTVCATVGGVPGQRMEEDHPEAELVTYDTVSKCVTDLQSGSVDAVTTDDAILRGYAAQSADELKVVGKPFSEDQYGIGLPKGDDELRGAVNDAVESAVENGSWTEAFEHTLGDSEGVKLPSVDRY